MEVERKLRRMLRNHGPGRTLRFVLNGAQWYAADALQRVEKWVAGRTFDLWYGVDTYGHIPLDRLDIDSGNVRHAVPYGPVLPRIFDRMLSALCIPHHRYMFVDLGSGKGRALLLAARYPFKLIVGVEFAKDLHEVAVNNVAAYRRRTGRGRNIRCIWGDAMEWTLPSEPLVLYMYNPFGEVLMKQVIENVVRSWNANPRSIFILYRTPECGNLFERHPLFKQTWTTKHFAVFQTPADGSRLPRPV